MGGFDQEYDPASPVGSDLASDIDTMIQAGSKSATAERFSLEHVPLDSSATGANDKNNANAQGRHLPGMVSVLLADTTVNIATFVAANQPPTGTGIGVGAIALDTTLGQLQRFNGTAFVNLGLSSTIYTAGDGILLVGQEFAIDPASVDDMVTGTSLTKVVTPAMSKWAFGNTEYMEAKQIQAHDVAEVVGTGPEYERHFPTVVVNTIIGASWVNDYTVELPIGEYLIDVQCPMWRSNKTDAVKLYMYDITNATLALDTAGKQLLSQSLNTDTNESQSENLRIVGTLVVSAVTQFSIRTQTGNSGIKGNVSGLDEQYGVFQLWKKKVVVT